MIQMSGSAILVDHWPQLHCRSAGEPLVVVAVAVRLIHGLADAFFCLLNCIALQTDACGPLASGELVPSLDQTAAPSVA